MKLAATLILFNVISVILLFIYPIRDILFIKSIYVYSGLPVVSRLIYNFSIQRIRNINPTSKIEAKRINEQIKSMSSIANNCATILVASILVKPIVDGIELDTILKESEYKFLYSIKLVFCAACAILLHIFAQTLLGELKDEDALSQSVKSDSST